MLFGQIPSCEEVTRLVSESLDRPLPLRKRIGLRVHYFICVLCRRYGEQLHFIRDAVRSYPERVEGQEPHDAPTLNPEARERMKCALSARDT
ncbi:MAG: zf-HC2 domain-containing protein [Nitrospiraceae bacterium]